MYGDALQVVVYGYNEAARIKELMLMLRVENFATHYAQVAVYKGKRETICSVVIG